jgi:hypothetical protein
VKKPRQSKAEEIMGVKAELAFDVCWEVYRGAREVLETKRGVGALDCTQDAKYLWRPDLRPKLKDWVADFALAGQAALREPAKASRMVMFRLYYLGLVEYAQARNFLGLSERDGQIGRRRYGGNAGRNCCGGGCFRRGSILMGRSEDCHRGTE